MIINIKSLQGDEYIVDVRDDHFVSDLKALICEKSAGNVPTVKQKLVFKGRIMEDCSLLSEYNLADGSKVHLILQKDKNISGSPSPSSMQAMEEATNNGHQSNGEMASQEATVNSSKEKQEPSIKSDDLKSKFEAILRERLAKLFPLAAVDKIMASLESEIDPDSSSLNDLELLAKEKLNISNE